MKPLEQFYTENSKLFSKKPDSIEGEDLVSGNYEDVVFTFSEIEAIQEKRTKNGSYEVTLFEGIFFVATFPKEIASNVVLQGKLNFTRLNDIIHFIWGKDWRLIMIFFIISDPSFY